MSEKIQIELSRKECALLMEELIYLIRIQNRNSINAMLFWELFAGRLYDEATQIPEPLRSKILGVEKEPPPPPPCRLIRESDDKPIDPTAKKSFWKLW